MTNAKRQRGTERKPFDKKNMTKRQRVKQGATQEPEKERGIKRNMTKRQRTRHSQTERQTESHSLDREVVYTDDYVKSRMASIK